MRRCEMLDVDGFCEMLVSNGKRRIEVLEKLDWVYMSYCSKDKLGEDEGWGWDEEVKKYRVIDIYKGMRFDLFRDVVKRERVDIRNVYVFSGKYGVVGGDVKISWYDKYFRYDELEDMKVKVREWVKGEIDKRGKFGVKYFIGSEIYERSVQYIKVIVDVLKEFEIEYKVIDLIYG